MVSQPIYKQSCLGVQFHYDAIALGGKDTKNIPARDPKQCAGAKGYESIGGGDDDDDDDDDDTHMRAQRSRHMRAHESRHIRAHI